MNFGQSNHNVRMSLVVALALATLFVLAFISVSALHATNRLDEYNADVTSTYEAEAAVTDLQTTLLTMESAQRGYSLTANPAYLKPYTAANARLASALKRLAEVSAGDPVQSPRYMALRPLILRRARGLSDMVSEVSPRHGNDSMRFVNKGGGERLMTQIRKGLSQMDTTDRVLLVAQTARASAESNRAEQLVFANVALVVLLLLFVMLIVRQDVSEQVRHYVAIVESQKCELEKANADLAQLARRDGLTGLFNYRSFQESLRYEFAIFLRFGTTLSLLMVDVDQFKEFNDSFGHPAGDEVLRDVGDLLHHEARESDIVARYGGEEFALLLPLTSLAEAVEMGERLRARIEKNNWAHRPITISIGADTVCDSIADPATFLEQADKALYRSKAAGRNRVTAADT